MTFYEIISQMNITCIYGAYKKQQAIPYCSYTGAGQDVFWADNYAYHRVNMYELVYYYTTKDEAKEDEIETALLDAGYTYDKSADFYDSNEAVYYIVYTNIKSLKGGR